MARRTGSPPPTKSCGSCGRTITWRRAWADDWEHVRWCSAACRRRKVTPVDRELEQVLRRLLLNSAGPVEVDEAAQIVGGDGWRDLAEPAKRAARRLHAAGEVVITQRGRVVADPSRTTGPLQVRRP